MFKIYMGVPEMKDFWETLKKRVKAQEAGKSEVRLYKKLGKVVNVVGLTIESLGPDAKLADLCQIMPEDETEELVIMPVTTTSTGTLLLVPLNNLVLHKKILLYFQ